MLCVVAGVLWGVSEPGVHARLHEAVSQRYKLAVKRYSDSELWRRALDRLHDSLGCCGVDNHSDWYSTSWLPLGRLPGHPSLYSKLVQPDGRVLVPLVPDSCCRVTGPDCGLDAWLRGNHSLEPAPPALLHASGCPAALANALALDLLLLRLLVLVLAALQVVMLVSTRYVWSSTLNSILLGRPRDAAPGWLVAGPRTGLLDHYSKICGDRKLIIEENKADKKSKWRCVDRFIKKRKEPKEAGIGAENTQRSRSPCFEKLKQRIKKSRESKKDMELKTKVNAETENYTGSDKDSYSSTRLNYALVQNKFSNKIIANLENETSPLLGKSQNVKVFDFAAKQNSPFIDAQITASQKLHGKSNKIETLKKEEVLKPIFTSIKQSSSSTESEKDFKKTRRLFERVATRINPREFHAKQPYKQQPVNLIDFEDLPTRIKPEVKETVVLMEDNHSPRSEAESTKVLLRNYRIPPNV